MASQHLFSRAISSSFYRGVRLFYKFKTAAEWHFCYPKCRMTRDALLPEHVYATHSLSIDQVHADQAEGLPRCMMTDAVSILVVARPSRVRTGLQTLLKTLPQVELIEAVDSGRDALPCVVERPPRLVLCDSSLPFHEMHEALQQIKAERPRVLSVVIINSMQDQALARQAGADAVLLTGYSAETLSMTISGLLARAESSESTGDDSQRASPAR